MANNTIFDDVFQTIKEKMPELTIPLINEVFGTDYSTDTAIVQGKNERKDSHKKAEYQGSLPILPQVTAQNGIPLFRFHGSSPLPAGPIRQDAATGALIPRYTRCRSGSQ